MRDPFQALEAEFNRQAGGHIGHATSMSYEGESGKRWKSFVYNGIINWTNTNIYWIDNFPNPTTKHVIFYENLVNDTEHELKKILRFLDVDVTESQMNCTMLHKEGLYHRSKEKVIHLELFDNDMRRIINENKERVYKILNAEAIV